MSVPLFSIKDKTSVQVLDMKDSDLKIDCDQRYNSMSSRSEMRLIQMYISISFSQSYPVPLKVSVISNPVLCQAKL
jgi:hypothetical protein